MWLFIVGKDALENCARAMAHVTQIKIKYVCYHMWL